MSKLCLIFANRIVAAICRNRKIICKSGILVINLTSSRPKKRAACLEAGNNYQGSRLSATTPTVRLVNVNGFEMMN